MPATKDLFGRSDPEVYGGSRDRDFQQRRERDSEQGDWRNRDGQAEELDAVAYVRFASVYREFKGCQYFCGRVKINS